MPRTGWSRKISQQAGQAKQKYGMTRKGCFYSGNNDFPKRQKHPKHTTETNSNKTKQYIDNVEDKNGIY